jgi:hypothetical protein
MRFKPVILSLLMVLPSASTAFGYGHLSCQDIFAPEYLQSPRTTFYDIHGNAWAFAPTSVVAPLEELKSRGFGLVRYAGQDVDLDSHYGDQLYDLHGNVWERTQPNPHQRPLELQDLGLYRKNSPDSPELIFDKLNRALGDLVSPTLGNAGVKLSREEKSVIIKFLSGFSHKTEGDETSYKILLKHDMVSIQHPGTPAPKVTIRSSWGTKISLEARYNLIDGKIYLIEPKSKSLNMILSATGPKQEWKIERDLMTGARWDVDLHTVWIAEAYLKHDVDVVKEALTELLGKMAILRTNVPVSGEREVEFSDGGMVRNFFKTNYPGKIEQLQQLLNLTARPRTHGYQAFRRLLNELGYSCDEFHPKEGWIFTSVPKDLPVITMEQVPN